SNQRVKMIGTMRSAFALIVASVASGVQISGPSPLTRSLVPGVRVEAVERGLEAERAGMKVGDVIVAWSRGETHGKTEERTEGSIQSPFDWTDLLIEYAPRGSLTLHGWRGDEEQQWLLGLREWGLTVQPVVRADLTSPYEQCRGFDQAGKHTDAV